MAEIFTSLGDKELTEMLKSGAIGVIPTDTVYGLVARADDPEAIERMYNVKARPNQAGTLIAASTEQLVSLGFPSSALDYANHYWPASLSVVIDATEVANYLKKDRNSLPVRIPDSPQLLDLLSRTGPLMTTSANPPGESTATNIRQAMEYFGDSVDFYVDIGDLGQRPPSTIVSFDEHGKAIVHRDGAVKISNV